MDVWIDYTNHRGERSWRHIIPALLWFGQTKWHPTDQWMLDARDLDRGGMRTFALKDVHSWKVPEPIAIQQAEQPA